MKLKLLAILLTGTSFASATPSWSAYQMLRELLSPFFPQWVPTIPATSSAAAGTWTIVQGPKYCTVSSGANSCTITLASALVAGNLYALVGYANNGGSGESKISSLSPSVGTLVTEVGCTGFIPGGVNFMPLCAYVLPSASTGMAGTSLTVNLDNNTGGVATEISIWEVHPSANGANVALDNSGAIAYTSSTTSQTGPSFTVSGTNDVSFVGWGPGTAYVHISSVSAPYNTLEHFESSNSYWGSSASISTSTPTWTPVSSVNGLPVSFSFGWNPTAGKEEQFNDFEGGTSGSTVTASAITTSARGWQGCTYTLTGTITWNTSASLPLLNTSPRLYGNGLTYASGAGTLGVVQTGSGASTANHIDCSVTYSNLQKVSDSVNFQSSLAVNDSTSVDIFYIKGSAAAVNFMFKGNGANRYVQLECNDTSTVSSGTVTIAPNTEYTLEILFDSAGGTHRGRVYSASQSLVGSEMTCSALSSNRFAGWSIGNTGAQVVTNGATNLFDSLQVDLSGTWPIIQ